MKLAELFTEITVRDTQFNSALASARTKLESVQSGLSSLSNLATSAFGVLGSAAKSAFNIVASAAKAAYGIAATAAKAATIAGIGFVAAIALSVRGFALAEQAESRLAGVLKATGASVGFTTKQLIAFGDTLERTSVHTTEEFLDTMSILGSFIMITGEQFKQATITASDMATVMGGDMQTAALQLGKALQDPILQLTRLQRSGVSFTKSQKELIFSLQRTGQLAKAQTMIMKAMAEQGFSGATLAAGKTFIGFLKQLQNAVGEVTDELGKPFAAAMQVISAEMKKAGLTTELWKERIKSFTDFLLNDFAPAGIKVFGMMETQVRILRKTWQTEFEIIKLQFNAVFDSMLLTVENWGVDLRVAALNAVAALVDVFAKVKLPSLELKDLSILTPQGQIRAVLGAFKTVSDAANEATKSVVTNLFEANLAQSNRIALEKQGLDAATVAAKLLAERIKKIRDEAGIEKIIADEKAKQLKIDKERLAVLAKIKEKAAADAPELAAQRRVLEDEAAKTDKKQDQKDKQAGILGIAELARKIQTAALSREEKEAKKQTAIQTQIESNTARQADATETMAQNFTGVMMPLAI